MFRRHSAPGHFGVPLGTPGLSRSSQTIHEGHVSFSVPHGHSSSHVPVQHSSSPTWTTVNLPVGNIQFSSGNPIISHFKEVQTDIASIRYLAFLPIGLTLIIPLRNSTNVPLGRIVCANREGLSYYRRTA